MRAQPPIDPIAELARALPEVYQPIFGRPELDARASRGCRERLEVIGAALAALPGRPLRVLDLGCAQGYFALSLLESGLASEVVGVDGQPANVALCQKLGEVSGKRARFLEARITPELIRELGRFDVVLGLSVLHHIAHEEGLASALAIVGAIASLSGAAILELALKEEGLYWAERLPADYREMLRPFPFWRILMRVPTHLGAVRRPLVFASTQQGLVGGKAFPFEEVLLGAHEFERGFHQGSRRYFLSTRPPLVCKQYDREPPSAGNLAEITAERDFLERFHGKISFAPALLSYEETDESVLLVREALPGVRLSHLMASSKPIDADGAIAAVLAQLVELEGHGLFHADLRPWNVLFDAPTGRWTLIDFGAISTSRRGVFEAFLAFCYAVLTLERPVYPAAVWPHFDPEQFPERYRALVEQVRRAPRDQLTFAQIQRWLQAPAAPLPPPGPEELNRKLDALYAALEESVNAHVPRLAMMAYELAGDVGRLKGDAARLRQAKDADPGEGANGAAAGDPSLQALHGELTALRAELDVVRAQVAGLNEFRRAFDVIRPLVRLAKRLKLL